MLRDDDDPVINGEAVIEAGASSAQAIIDAARRFAEVRLLPADGNTLPVVAVPHGMRLQVLKPLLDSWADAPDRREGTTTLTTIEAFVAWMNRFKDTDSIVYLDDTNLQQPRLVGIIDYHREGAEGKPRFQRHRAVYEFPVSNEWAAWTSRNGKPTSQAAFAEFLEDHLVDIYPGTPPLESLTTFATTYGITLATPAALLEVSKNLHVTVEQKLIQHTNLSTGEALLQFEESHSDKAGGQVKFPRGFAIAIPVFRGEPPIAIPVRLRYKADGQKVIFTMVLYRLDIVMEHALLKAMKRVAEDTALPVLRGKPEVPPAKGSSS